MLGLRARSLCLPQSMYLDPLNALGDDVGMVHGHQRDLDSGHPAHSAGPHSCGQSRDKSALLCLEGWPARWGGAPVQALLSRGNSSPSHPGPSLPPQRKARLREQPARARGQSCSPAQLTTQGVWMEPCSVSTAATRRTPKSSVRTRMPVTGQFSMTWEREGLLPEPCRAPRGC